MEQDAFPARLMMRSSGAVPKRHTAFGAAARHRHEEPALPFFPRPRPLHLPSATVLPLLLLRADVQRCCAIS